jgi:hypothetical protein
VALRWLRSFFQSHDSGNFPGTEAFRKARALITGRSEPTVDAYPDRDAGPPRVSIVLMGGDLVEPVDLDGFSVREIVPGLGTEERRRWLADRIIRAHYAIFARLEEREAEGS